MSWLSVVQGGNPDPLLQQSFQNTRLYRVKTRTPTRQIGEHAVFATLNEHKMSMWRAKCIYWGGSQQRGAELNLQTLFSRRLLGCPARLSHTDLLLSFLQPLKINPLTIKVMSSLVFISHSFVNGLTKKNPPSSARTVVFHKRAASLGHAFSLVPCYSWDLLLWKHSGKLPCITIPYHYTPCKEGVASVLNILRHPLKQNWSRKG